MNIERAVSYHTYVRVVLFAAVGTVFIFYFINDLNPSGELSVSYNFCKPSPYISALSPLGRVLNIDKKEGYCVQRMVIDPVYVDVRLPQRYDTVAMVLVYQNPDGVSLRAGPWTSTAEWQWDLKPFEKIEEGEIGWHTAVTMFDILNAPMERRRLRFMLSAPGLSESGKEVVIRELRFTFKKPAFNWNTLKRWGASFLDR